MANRGEIKMKQKIFMAAMIIVALTLSLGVNAKGKPGSVVLLKDANGVKIGRVIGMETVSWPYVLTDQGYRTLFRVGTGMIYNEAPVFYESTDCTGDAYVGKRSPGTVFLPTLQDSLAYTIGVLLYSPNDAQGIIIITNSTLDYDLNCISYISEREAYPAYPNDPNITGIQNTTYSNRMVIE
jgi:hypothetical protein